jgi:hypothetical protein
MWALRPAIREDLRGFRSILLTPERPLATVRRFREYPERAVRKRLGVRLSPAQPWIQEIHRRIAPDNRGEVSKSAAGFALSAYLIAPATPSTLLYHKRDPMWMGYVGRNSETELGPNLLRGDQGTRPPSTVICLECGVFAVCAVRSTAACRIQNFAGVCSFFRRSEGNALRLSRVRFACDKKRDRSCPAQRPNKRFG